MKRFSPLFLVLLFPKLALAWGAIAHKIVTQQGAGLVPAATLKNCQVSVDLLVDHTNDPDTVWKGKRREFPRESKAHYFHIPKQPADWKTRTTPENYKDGFLVYRIVDWVKEAKEFKKEKNWDKLKERLYGLTHYLGDLTQPLHLHHDYDGVGAGLPGLHSQFETKMIARYESELLSGVKDSLANEQVPSIWSQIKFDTLIFTTAEQSSSKASKLFDGARPAREEQKSKSGKNSKSEKERFRFVKEKLWNGTGDMAIAQVSLGSRLVAKMLTEVCQ